MFTSDGLRPAAVTLIAAVCLLLGFHETWAETNNSTSSGVETGSDEVRLVHFLLQRYSVMGKIARPTYNSSTAVPVWFGLRLIQLEVDEREQLMRTSVWVRYRWLDEYLRWDPAEFGGLGLITLPWNKVWIPDIVLVNTASTSVAERPADIMVSSEGGVFWSPHRMYKSGCMIDISNFPFDEHTCDLWFQSMSHFTWHLDLRPFPGSPWDLQTYLASYKDSQGWQITRNFTDRFDSKRKPGLILKFSKRVALLFSLTVSRRPGYTCHLLMLPCVFLGALTLVVFCLPAERPDRITLAMSLFGSFLVLLLILVEAAPPSAASVPQLGVYYACNMVLIITSVFLSASVVNVSRGGERRLPVPRWMRYLFLDLLSRPLLLRALIARVLGPEPPGCRTGTGGWATGKDGYGRPADSTECYSAGHPGDERDYSHKDDPAASPLSLTADPGKDSAHAVEVNRCLVSIDERLHRLESGHAHTRAHAQREDWPTRQMARSSMEWKMVAMVMDRVYFVCYVTALVLSAVIFFPRPAEVLRL